MFGKRKSFYYNDTISIDIFCEILYNTQMLSQEDICIITDIVSTQISLGIGPLEKRMEKSEKKASSLEKKIEQYRADLKEELLDFEDTVTKALRNNQNALFIVIKNSEEAILKRVEILNGSFQSTIRLISLNRRDITRIEEHLGLYPSKIDTSNFTLKVAEETEEYGKTNS